MAGGKEPLIENGESIPVRRAVIWWYKNQKNFNEIKTFLMQQGGALGPRSLVTLCLKFL